MSRWYTRPVLFVSDIDRACSYYVQKLGFTESWRHMDDGRTLVAQVERAGCELILTCQWPGKAGSGLVFVSLNPEELGSARTEFEGRSVEVQNGWWGYELMIVADPDGNQLYFPCPQEQ